MKEQKEKAIEKSYWQNFKYMPWVLYYYMFMMFSIWLLIVSFWTSFGSDTIELMRQQGNEALVTVIYVIWIVVLVSIPLFVQRVPKVGVRNYRIQLFLISLICILATIFFVAIGVFTEDGGVRYAGATFPIGLIVGLYFAYVRSPFIKDFYNGNYDGTKDRDPFDRIRLGVFWIYLGCTMMGIGMIIPSTFLMIEDISLLSNSSELYFVVVGFIFLVVAGIVYRFEKFSKPARIENQKKKKKITPWSW